MISIRADNLVKQFGLVRALDAVTLEIRRGELFFLLGPSGCGKTTLLRSIAGFYIPDGGRLLFGERDMTRVPPRLRGTGMVFQNYALWPHMTVEANVAFGLAVRGVGRDERRKRVAEALDIVRMGEYSRRKPNQLSGGQQQRVALARAMVIRPQCLLLDEPLSNLDAKLRLEMRGEIRRICKQFELTAVYVTHDQKEALSVADRMAVMFQGRVAQVGAPRELYRNPTSQRVADFLGESNFYAGTIRSGSGDQRIVETPLGLLEAQTDVTAPVSGKCLISIRPEAVLLQRSDELGRTGEYRRGSADAHVCPRCREVSPKDASFCMRCGADLAGAAGGKAGTVNYVHGRVQERTYLGEATQVTLAVGTATLMALLAERAGASAPKAGDPVAFTVNPADVVILPPDK